MKLNPQMADYLYQQRWCNFKEQIRQNEVENISFETLPFDEDKKIFVIGKVTLSEDAERYFMMPLAVTDENTEGSVKIGSHYYTDATKQPDYWEKMMQMFQASDNVVEFPNGWKLEYKNTGIPEVISENANSSSRPLGVEQSNTTLMVGNEQIAFKLERMLDFSHQINPEFEMNEKLMRENCQVMPKTYGYLLLHNTDGTKASSGIIQEFVKNQGDLWNYSLSYLKERLTEGYLSQRPITPENNPEFMAIMQNLSQKTAEMSECLSRPDDNPAFTPEPVDETFIRNYSKNMETLLYQTKRSITHNLDKLPEPTHTKAAFLLDNWSEMTGSFIEKQMTKITQSEQDKGYTTRVHGDFHLGQVMVTKDNDLRFIDFAGEPDLPLEQRKQKHIYIRDVAGMYRSIKGYLGAVAVEEFASEAGSPELVASRKEYASKAIQPLIDAASSTFLGNHSLKEPWLSLEVLRKNLYEVNYEVNNRPQMAYVAINGLSDLLPPPPAKSMDRSAEILARSANNVDGIIPPTPANANITKRKNANEL